MRRFDCLTAAVVLAAMPGFANTPIIRNSEVTATLLCLRYDGENAAMVPVCQAALLEPGHTDSVEEELYFNLGYAHYKTGRYQAARVAFDKGLALNPQSARLHEQKGWSYFDENAYSEAETSFRLSRDIHANAYNLSGLASSMFYAGGTADASIPLIDQALVLDPRYMWGWRQKGWILYDSGNFAASDAEFSAILAVDKNDANAHYGRARVAYDRDNLEEALAHLNRAIAIEAEIGAHQRLLAMIAYHQEKYALSIAAGGRALDRAPDDATAAAYVAFAHDELGRRAVALEVMRDAARAGARGMDFNSDYATLLRRDRQWAAALARSEQVVADERADAGDFAMHAMVLLELERYEGALRAGQRAARLDRSAADGPHMAARALVYLGRYQEAATMIVAARENGLNDDDFSEFLGLLLGKGEALLARQLRQNPKQFNSQKSARSR